MEKLSRRKVLVSLAAAGAAAAAVVGTASAQDRHPADLRAQEARLRNVLEHVETANDHIKGVAARWVAPPDPDRPAFNALLENINSECQGVMDTASELLLSRGA